MRNLIFLFFSIGIIFPFTASSEQVFPDDLHCMPVLIEIPLQDKIHSEFGTGVYLFESNNLFLVTAAHCIFNVFSTNKFELINSNAIISSFARGKDAKDKNIFSLNLASLNDEGLIKRHAAHDVAVIRIAQVTQMDTNGAVLYTWNIGEVQLLSKREFNLVSFKASGVCELFNDVSDGDESYILGYPRELFIGQPSEIDFESPLVRKGIISQKNLNSRKLIIDSAVYGGNSGGPVLIQDQPSLGSVDYKIVGIVTQFVPVVTKPFPQGGITNSALVNSGYSVAEPIDYALELMRQ
jgi:V8-like Glu-specific endopeptidase